MPPCPKRGMAEEVMGTLPTLRVFGGSWDDGFMMSLREIGGFPVGIP